jgi:hypothetical protein
MIKNVYQITVETDIEEDVLYISQENQSNEDGKDSIVLDPCQIDLLIKLLQHAKEDFFKHSRVETACNSNSVMVCSK